MDKKIITLTSDFGLQGFYTAYVKGALLTAAPQATIIDITNNINEFDIKETAFIVRSCYRKFPAGTIHAIFVESDPSENDMLALMFLDNQYFLCADNGILPMIAKNKIHELFYIDIKSQNDTPFDRTIDIFSKIISDLPNAPALDEYLQPVEKLKVHLLGMEPSIIGNELNGNVIFIDNYGNAITNISKDIFYKFVGENNFSIFINSITETLCRISNEYSDVESRFNTKEAAIFATFGVHGYLEIGMYHSQGANLLGLKRDSDIIVRI